MTAIPSINNEAASAPTPKAPELQVNNSDSASNAYGSPRQDFRGSSGAMSGALTFTDRTLTAVRRGFSIIPGDVKGKGPYGLNDGRPRWGAKARINTEEGVRAFAAIVPADANYCICSDDTFTILETDNRSALLQLLSRPLPETFEQAARENRAAFIFRQTPRTREVLTNTTVSGLFEWRHVNFYVVGFGSIHPTGAEYRIICDKAPVEMPDWLIDELLELKKTAPPSTAQGGQGVPAWDAVAAIKKAFLANFDHADMFGLKGVSFADSNHPSVVSIANFLNNTAAPLEDVEELTDLLNRLWDEYGDVEHKGKNEVEDIALDAMKRLPCTVGTYGFWEGLKWALKKEDLDLLKTANVVSYDVDFAREVRSMQPSNQAPKDRLRIVRFSNIQTEKIKWVWPGKLAVGHLTTLNGDPGAKKSFASLDLVARISTGRPMPDGQPNPFPPSYVLVLTREDGLADTVKPRFLAAGGDPDKLISLACGDSNETANFKLETQLDDLDKILDDLDGEVRLIVFDPLLDFMKAGQNNEAEVRDVLTKLKQFAERRGLCVIGINHLNKKSDLDAIHRTMGAKGFIGVARLNFLIGQDESGTLHLSSLKNNLWQDDSSLTFRLEDSEIIDGHIHISKVGRVMWTGKGQITANELAAPKGKTTPNRAADWLKGYLKPAGEKKAASQIYEAGKKEGFSEDQIKRALPKVALYERVGMPATTVWWVQISEESIPW